MNDRKSPTPLTGLKSVRLFSLAMLILLILAFASAFADSEVPIYFDIPAGPLSQSLQQFATQADRELVYTASEINAHQAAAVVGTHTPHQALLYLLAQSDLSFSETESGVIMIRAESDTGSGSAPPRTPPRDGHDHLDESGDMVAASPAVMVDTIVVTARKREELASRVPAALSVFSGAQIEETGAREIGDFIQAAPSVSFVADGGFQQLSIRGIGTSLGGNANSFYLDEVPFTGVSVPWNPNVQPFDLDRVEVLRGPQGTLFGEGSVGGTVRILTNAPDTGQFGAKAETFFSDTEGGATGWGARAMINLPLAEDFAALRVVGIEERRGGWLESLAGNKNFNNDDISTYRARLRLTPGTAWTIDLGAWKYSQDLDGNSRALDSGQGTSSDPISQGYEQRSATVAYDLGWGSLSYAFGRNNLDNQVLAVIPGLGQLNANIDIRVETHELLLNASRGSWALTAGLYWSEADRNDGVRLLGGPLPLDVASNYLSKSNAIFAEAEYAFAERWRLALGIRRYQEDLDVAEVGLGFLGPIDVAYGDSFDSINPRVVLSFEPTPERLIYASASKGFRGGQAQPAAAVQLAGLLGLDLPETLSADSIWSYELGAKALLLDNRLFLEGAIFYSDWSDPAVRFDLAGTGFNGLISAQGVETKGFEFSGLYQLSPVWALRGGFSYLDPRFKSAVAGSPIAAGDRPEQTSKVSWNAALSYDAPVFGDFNLVSRLGAQYFSKRENTAFASNLPGDNVTLLDARVGLRSARVGVFAFINNLSNTFDALEARAENGAARPRPRTIGVELAVYF